jgi:hypothetical protein
MAAIWSRRCPLWVKSRHCGISNQCPLYPQKRTWLSTVVMSALCQKQTSAFQTDHLAVTAERRNAHREIAISALAFARWGRFHALCQLPCIGPSDRMHAWGRVGDSLATRLMMALLLSHFRAIPRPESLPPRHGQSGSERNLSRRLHCVQDQ